MKTQMEEEESRVNVLERFKSLAGQSRVAMEHYSTMEPHEARSLLPRELWKGILREGTLAILGGESKAKKSWFSLSFAMAAVAGTSIFLYLFLRSQGQPWLNWNDPETFSAFWGTLTRRTHGGTLDLLSKSYAAGENFLPQLKVW